jgi:predicted acylesterase/phospholipase RssA
MNGGALRSDQVKFLSFEGGGRAGLIIHPGVVHALDELDVLTYDAAGRQNGVEGIAGSSSGSVVSTLVSCGYRYDEIAVLLSEPAFDLVFRLEEFRLGQFSTLNGACVQRSRKIPPWIAAPSAIDALDDPVGAVLNSVMMTQSMFEDALANGGLFDQWHRARLTRFVNRFVTREDWPSWLEGLVEIASGGIQREIKETSVEWGKEGVLKWVQSRYPHVVYKLLDHLLNANNRVHKNLNNALHVFKWDFGVFAGCAWRDFIDHLVSFARFRVYYASLLPALRIPIAAEFNSATSLDQVFLDRIRAAATAQGSDAPRVGPDESLPDFEREYKVHMRNTTFEQHRADLYPGRTSADAPPLAMSGANLSTQESHLFSAETTPWLCVADAVRIASGLPPLFKPVILEKGDIPSNFPLVKSSVDDRHFLEGYWMDGGIYWNSPFDTFTKYESSLRQTLGIGIGRGQRVVIDDLTDYLTSMSNVVYERNVSATRSDLSRFVVLDNFEISVTGPRMTEAELDFYREYGWWQTLTYFGHGDQGPSLP